jgi:hypothetical protein
MYLIYIFETHFSVDIFELILHFVKNAAPYKNFVY